MRELIIDNYFSESDMKVIDEIEKIERLGKKEELDLVKKAQSGDVEARNKVIKANLCFVMNTAAKFINRGVDFLDLIQEGSIGLVEAIDNYQYSKKLQFRRFSYYYIYGAMNRITKESDLVKKPVDYVEFCEDIENISNDLSFKLNREPTIEEIAYDMGVSNKEVEEGLLNSLKIESLDKELNMDDDYFLIDFLEDYDDYEDIRNIDTSDIKKLNLTKRTKYEK